VSNPAARERPQDVVERLRGEVTELRRSRRRLVEAATADRKALERDLHDGVQQHLVALAVDLRRLSDLVDDPPAAAHQLLDEMAANLREAMVEATALAEKVYPPLLEGRGLAASLRSAAERSGITIVVDVPAGAGYPPEITAAVYWSCVEALASASLGSQATVSVQDADGALTFEIAVAGRQPVARIDRLRDRIEALDGRLTISDDELVSRVHVWLPLSR
jgi:signal transduction histidine kinase